jgi:hypothetical protein
MPIGTYLDVEYDQAHQKAFAAPQIAPITAVLPDGVSQNDFNTALLDFAAIVGPEQVFVGDALAHYVDPYELHENDATKRKMPGAAVCPASMEELSRILKVANAKGLPMWTFSRGKNLGYGGPAPRLNGSVALDLHRMTRILEVNDEHAYAVVEPGVTFHDLYNYCVKHDKKLWPSTPSLGWGSVIGNTLDRGVGFGVYGNHHGSIAGAEVMLADGDIVRTGQWGIENSPSSFISKFTFGPSLEGLFLQSNLAIVTKLSMWLAPRPTAYMSCTFSVPEDADVEIMVDALGELRRNGIIPNMIWVGNFVEGICIRGKRSKFWQGEGPIPDWRLKELQQEFGDEGFWTAKWGLYGPASVIKAQYNEIESQLRSLAPIGKLVNGFYEEKDGNPLDAKTISPEHGLMFVGFPTLWSLPLMDWALSDDKPGKAAHGDYAPIIPSSGKHVLHWAQECKKIYARNNLDLMLDFFMHERHVVCMSMYAYDQLNAEHCANVDRAYSEMHQVAKQAGYGMYRGHVNHMGKSDIPLTRLKRWLTPARIDEIAELNNFNNHAYIRFVEKIKVSRCHWNRASGIVFR